MRTGYSFICLLAFLTLSSTLFGQGNSFYINGNGGHNLFYGDVRQRDFFPDFDEKEEYDNFGTGLEIGYEFTPFLDIHLGAHYGNLGGVLRDTFTRLFNNEPIRRGLGPDGEVKFESRFIDGSLNARFYPLNLLLKRNPDKKKIFAPYIKAGLGAIIYQSLKTKADTSNQYLGSVGFDDLDDEDWQESFIIPVGIGTKFRLAPRLDLGLDYTHNFLPNDDVLDLTPGDDAHDMYGYTNVSLTFTFGKDSHAKHWYNNGDHLNDKIKDLEEKTDANEAKSKANEEELVKIQELADEMGKDLDEVMTLDTDGDGVPNYKDKSNNTPNGVEVDADGVPVETDSDGDGIPDRLDKEANTPKGNTVNWEGVSVVTLEDALARERALRSSPEFDHKFIVFFDTDKSRVKPEGYDKLIKVAEILNKTGKTGYLTGHADLRGSETYNERLSQKRAEAVSKILVDKFGVQPSQLVIEAKGENEPLSEDKSRDLKVNRRVDILIR